MKNSQKDRDIEYINSQISQLKDGYLIEQLIKMRKQIENKNEKSPQKKFRESIAVSSDKFERPERQQEKRTVSKQVNRKRKIKGEPKKSFGKMAFHGMIAGLILGVPVGIGAYKFAYNLPSSNNYITVKEAKKGITDRKDHDSSNYKKYLMKTYGLSESEADEKIEQEEKERRWER